MPPVQVDQQVFVRIHSRVADGGAVALTKKFENGVGQSAVNLWYLVRGWDRNGCGWAEFTLQEAATALNKSIPTIKRYLKQGQKLGFFYNPSKHGNNIRLYYRSLFKVCEEFELDNWGAVTEISIDELPQLKLIATEIETQRLQDSSRYQATRVHRNGVAEPNELIAPSHSSRGVKGNVIHRGNTALFVDEHFVPFGTSQRTIANSLSRSDRTIRKRLSNSYRCERGLAPLDRVQLVQTSTELNDRYAVLLRQFERSELKMMDGVWMSDWSDRLFVCNGLVFKSLCNVYAKENVLHSMKRSRSVFKKRYRSNTDRLDSDSLRISPSLSNKNQINTDSSLKEIDQIGNHSSRRTNGGRS